MIELNTISKQGFIFSIICKRYTFTDYVKIIICGFGITVCYLFVSHESLVTNFELFVLFVAVITGFIVTAPKCAKIPIQINNKDGRNHHQIKDNK